jgi:hypothetical protein
VGKITENLKKCDTKKLENVKKIEDEGVHRGLKRHHRRLLKETTVEFLRSISV